MNSTLLTSVAATGFTVAFLHAAIPTHWLPFVLVARARQWTAAKTLGVAMVAGLGHVALTSLLGLGIAWFGFSLDEHLGEWFTYLTGGALLCFAAYYFWRQLQGRGVCHHHPPGGHHQASPACGHEGDRSHWETELAESPLVSGRKSDWAAISGLFVMLTLSPCEGFLPVYLSGVEFGWTGFFLLSAILAVGTLAGMTLFTSLTLVGLSRVHLRRFERYEAGLLGASFTVLALIVMFVDHGHGHAH